MEYQSPQLEIVKNDKGEVDYAKSQVICSECHLPIKSVTEFTKRSMRFQGQIKRNDNSKKAFAVECQQCHKKDQPIMIGKEVGCPHCGIVHANLAPPFKQIVIQYLNSSL